MRSQDPARVALLGAASLGLIAESLLGCTTLSEAQPATEVLAAAPAPLVDGWIEAESTRAPLSLAEAARLSAEQSLAAGHYAAAEASLGLALEFEPELAALRFAAVEAKLGLGQFEAAAAALDEIEYQLEVPSDELERFAATLSTHRTQIRERAHALGDASCEATLDSARVPLEQHEDFVSIWAALHGQLDGVPATTDIPTNDRGARGELCEDACNEQLSFVRLDTELGSIVALVLSTEAGELYLVPELLRPVSDSCEDDTLLALERHGDMVRVRAFSDTREEPKTEDWRLGIEAELGAIQAKVAAAGIRSSGSSGYYGSGSSGYGSSGYGSSGYGSSGYGSSGYGSSGYYGCDGGYDYYDYDDMCEAVRGVQRDTFIDLARGEVVLDIVRTGPADAGLGEVRVESGRVHVQACGVDERLPLSWTQA